MRLMLDWLRVRHLTMDEWRYVYMDYGGQCVITGGTSEMLKLCVDSYNTMDVSVYTLVMRV